MGLLAVNVLVFVLWGQAAHDEAWLQFMSDNFTVSQRSVAQGRFWTLLTAAFSHYESMHLLFNAYALWLFGRPVARVIGGLRLLGVYLVGGVVSSLGHAAYNAFSGDPVPALGASGSVMALGVLFAALFPHVRLLLFFVVPLSARTAFIAFVALDVLGLLGRGGGIAHAAHLGGALYGLVYYWLAIRPGTVSRR